ncbi:unnamed protein product [Ilex paraguariensis]
MEPSLFRRGIGTNPSLSSLTVVFLHDWWLIKADRESEGKQIGVGGFASREGQGIRLFHSAAIAKRHDTVTLETVDGITITICGLINRTLSHQNGFLPKVCNHFLFGFPYDWEKYATQCFSEDSLNGADKSRVTCLDGSLTSPDDDTVSFLPLSIDDLTVTRTRDLFMSTLGEPENCLLTKSIFNDILQKCSDNAFAHNGSPCHSNKASNNRGMTEDIPDESPSNNKRTKVDQKCKDATGISNVRHMTTYGSICKSVMGKDVHNLTKRVATRSMTTSTKHGLSEPLSASESSGSQCGHSGTRRNASSALHANISSEDKTEVKQTPFRYAARRLRELKNSSDSSSLAEAPGNGCEWMETRVNASNVSRASKLFGGETEMNATPDKSVIRRSNRLKNLKKPAY